VAPDNSRCLCVEKHGSVKRERRYKCSSCAYAAYTASMLQRHEVRHTPCRQPQHRCDMCGARLMTIYSLNEHKRLSHVDERPFPCAICGFTAKCQYTTHTHVTHTQYWTMMSINCIHCTYPRVHMSTLSPQCHEESPVTAECCSTPYHRSQTSWPHYAGARSTTLASCSAASGVQTGLFGAPGIVQSNAYLPGWWYPSRLRGQPTIPSVFLW